MAFWGCNGFECFRFVVALVEIFQTKDIDSCMEMEICRYDPKPEPAYLRTKNRKPCARNGGKLCPYENGSGTCFGFCIKEILKEHWEKKGCHAAFPEDAGQQKGVCDA